MVFFSIHLTVISFLFVCFDSVFIWKFIFIHSRFSSFSCHFNGCITVKFVFRSPLCYNFQLTWNDTLSISSISTKISKFNELSIVNSQTRWFKSVILEKFDIRWMMTIVIKNNVENFFRKLAIWLNIPNIENIYELWIPKILLWKKAIFHPFCRIFDEENLKYLCNGYWSMPME